MSNINVDSLLAQMRALSAQSGLNKLDEKLISESDKLNFAGVLKESLDKVNTEQQKAGEMAKAFEMGDENIDLAQVMVQMQKARVSFEALSQVRNRLISAYHDIMNMQV